MQFVTHKGHSHQKEQSLKDVQGSTHMFTITVKNS